MRYFECAKEVARSIRPCASDTLFLYTEYELVNHFIAMRFKEAGARVYLLEDGGVGTYLPFSLVGGELLSLKEHIIAAMTRVLPGLSKTRFHKVNGMVFPWMDDAYLDGVCLYRPLKIVRSIPVHVLSGASNKPVSPHNGRVIFLNERMYDDYQTEQQYIEGLDRILASLEHGFDEVYFKFHPREETEWTSRIRKILALKHPSVQIISDTRAVEALIPEYRPEVMASYFSTALLNLSGTGIEPMFLYQLLPELASQKVFTQLSALLNQWNYHFVKTWNDARSGYQSNLSSTVDGIQLTISDLVMMDDKQAQIRRTIVGDRGVQS